MRRSRLGRENGHNFRTGDDTISDGRARHAADSIDSTRTRAETKHGVLVKDAWLRISLSRTLITRRSSTVEALCPPAVSFRPTALRSCCSVIATLPSWPRTRQIVRIGDDTPWNSHIRGTRMRFMLRASPIGPRCCERKPLGMCGSCC